MLVRSRAALLLLACSVACAGDAPEGESASSTASASTSSSAESSGTARQDDSGGETGSGGVDTSGGDPDTGGTEGGTPPEPPDFVREFDPLQGELPEGLVVRQGEALVGLGPARRIVRVDVASGEVTPFAELAVLPPSGSLLLGLALGPENEVFAAVATPHVQGGIHRVASGGGMLEAFATHPAMVFPNGMVYAPDDGLFVADSSGVIFRVSVDGSAEEWLAHALLTGQSDACPEVQTPFPIGANGIALYQGALYVTNTNRATVLRIPVLADGSAGAPAIHAGPDCERLGGVDGIHMDDAGTLLLAVFGRNSIVRISSDGELDVLYEGPPFEQPASVAVVAVPGARTGLVTNSSLQSVNRPGLLGIDVP